MKKEPSLIAIQRNVRAMKRPKIAGVKIKINLSPLLVTVDRLRRRGICVDNSNQFWDLFFIPFSSNGVVKLEKGIKGHSNL
jgi:hypothetical protein